MEQRHRKRGIKASREKLERVMLDQGIETQAALAQKMAQLEGIERPPKDLVNKVFREQAVSTHNLTRVANALNVPAHTIYLSSSDQTFEDTVEEQTKHNPKPEQILKHHRYKAILLVLVALAVISPIVWFLQHSGNVAQPRIIPRVTSAFGKSLMLIQAKNASDPFAMSLTEAYLERDDISAEIISLPDALSLPPKEALEKWQAHMVLRIDRHYGEYYQLLTVRAVSASFDEIIFQVLGRGSELETGRKFLTDQLQQEINKFIEGYPVSALVAENKNQIQALLRLKDGLFEAHNPSQLTQSQTLLEQLNGSNPSSSLSLISCELYTRKSWHENETQSLEKAASDCSSGANEKVNLHLLYTAQAELISQTKEVSLAISTLEDNLLLIMPSADAFSLLADLHLRQFTGAQEEVEIIEDYASKALTLEAKHWRAYNTLGNLYYRAGQIAKAKTHFYEASQIVKQDVILTNLGAMQMCFDELDAAEQTYLSLIEEIPEGYLGYESLGTIYFFKHKFEEALSLKTKAIELNPDIAIHQIWASLAEIYNQLEDKNNAKKHYTKAMTILERDKMLENIGEEASLYEAYYNAKIQLLDELNLLQMLDNNMALQLHDDQASLGLREKAHLAWLLEKAGLHDAGRNVLNEISEVCPVYLRSPELDLL